MPAYRSTGAIVRPSVGLDLLTEQMRTPSKANAFIFPENGVDIDRSQSPMPHTPKVPLQRHSSGVLVPIQRRDMLLEAAKNCCRREARYYISLATAEERSSLEKLVKELNVEQRFSFTVADSRAGPKNSAPVISGACEHT